MEKSNFCLVIRVRDMQKCRAFYRDTLGLGSPVLDSPFWVEFQMSETGKICLETVPGETGGPVRNGLSPVWCLESDDDVQERLASAGIKSDGSGEIVGRSVLRFQDPEGNPFYLVNSKE